MNKVAIVIAAVAVIIVCVIACFFLISSDDSEKETSLSYGEGFEMTSIITKSSNPTDYEGYVFKTTSYSPSKLEMSISMKKAGLSTNATMLKVSDIAYTATIDSMKPWYYYAEYVPSEGRWILATIEGGLPELTGYHSYVLSFHKDDNILFRLTEVVINTFNMSFCGTYSVGYEEPFKSDMSEMSLYVFMKLRGPSVCEFKNIAFGESGESYKQVVQTGGAIVRTNDADSQVIIESCMVYKKSDPLLVIGPGYTIERSSYYEGEVQDFRIFDSGLNLLCSYDVAGAHMGIESFKSA